MLLRRLYVDYLSFLRIQKDEEKHLKTTWQRYRTHISSKYERIHVTEGTDGN